MIAVILVRAAAERRGEPEHRTKGVGGGNRLLAVGAHAYPSGFHNPEQSSDFRPLRDEQQKICDQPLQKRQRGVLTGANHNHPRAGLRWKPHNIAKIQIESDQTASLP